MATRREVKHIYRARASARAFAEDTALTYASIHRLESSNLHRLDVPLLNCYPKDEPNHVLRQGICRPAFWSGITLKAAQAWLHHIRTTCCSVKSLQDFFLGHPAVCTF